MKQAMKNNIVPLFSALNSHIELLPEPLNLMNLGFDCLNIIGNMVIKNNIKRWKKWKKKYFGNMKKKMGFVTEWHMFDVMDFTLIHEEHPYDIPMTIRNYNTSLGYRTEAVVVGFTWLDIWQACDSVIRNAKDSDGDEDERKCIESLVKLDSSFDRNDLSIFLDTDDEDDTAMFINITENIDVGNIWYLKCSEHHR